MVKNSKQSPIKTRSLTARECLWRAIVGSLLAFAMVFVFILEWYEKERQWLFLGLAALHVSFAWTWWKRYLLLLRGNRKTGFDLFGIISMQKTVTTTIQTTEPDQAQMPAIVSVPMTSLLTVMALGLFVVSTVVFTAPRNSVLDRLFMGTLDLVIATFTAYCWMRVNQSARSQRSTDDRNS